MVTFSMEASKYKEPGKGESKYYTELKLTWRRDYWTWVRVHTLGRQSTDGGVRMLCERLAGKVARNILLTEHDIEQLDRLNDKR